MAVAMLEVHELAPDGPPDEQLVLPFDQRKRSRLRATLHSGEAVGVFLERGTVLRDGTLLRADDGRTIAVIAAPEEVSTVRSLDARLLARVAYHLGNRHVPVQVGPGFVRYQRDHVLDSMVVGLGAEVVHGTAPFEPEAGAYDQAAAAG